MLARAPRDPAFADDAAYRRIARTIAYLAAHVSEQPNLASAAAVAGLSPSHFQRLFTRYAGVSPKDFVAHLSLERARRSLAAGANVRDAAWDAGLSGPSRLHDLTLKIEAMTPGAMAKGGAGLTLSYSFIPTLFGAALLVASERGLCGLAFADEGEETMALTDMRARWPCAAFAADASTVAPYAAAIFARAGELPIRLYGTKWQIAVWRALLAIPEGRVTSYRALAQALGGAEKTRAAASAVARNPIALLIPCHRVLASDGALGGYHWGLARKRALLAWETAKR